MTYSDDIYSYPAPVEEEDHGQSQAKELDSAGLGDGSGSYRPGGPGGTGRPGDQEIDTLDLAH